MGSSKYSWRFNFKLRMRLMRSQSFWVPILMKFRSNAKGNVEEIGKGGNQSGLAIIFYYKFRFEFNFIELYWGYCRRFLRPNCDYTWNGLQNTLPVALDNAPISSICKFARKCLRYMEAYRAKNGHYLTQRQIEYAVLRYRGHRYLEYVLEDLNFKISNIK